MEKETTPPPSEGTIVQKFAFTVDTKQIKLDFNYTLTRLSTNKLVRNIIVKCVK